MACGLTRKTFNPEMSELLNKISKTVYDTVSNSTMEILLPSLMTMLGQGNGAELIGVGAKGSEDTVEKTGGTMVSKTTVPKTKQGCEYESAACAAS
ncbi:hypothetical protein GQ600_6601 [Phytophthora cactorum]|nr:hypothetical protein GQ600_6601 [Phytophthora cactorum]